MKHLLYFIICLSYLVPVFAQQNPIRFQKLTANSGLSQGHVLCMIQDKEGYIWAGTYNGLNRYNGHNFDVFYSDPKKPNSLAINVIFSLFEDHAGKIWCGTWGIDIFDPETETIVKHIPAESGPNSISAGEVSSIEEDKNGIMWLGTRIGGLNKYDPVTEKIELFKSDSTKKNGLQSDQINDLLIDKKGYLWIATEGGGLSKMQVDNELIKTYRHNSSDPGSLPSDKITCIFESRDGTLWFGDNFGSLFRYSAEKDAFYNEYSCQENGNPKKVRIMQIAQSLEGKLLIATIGMGLIEFDPALKDAQLFLHESNDDESLLANENWSVLVNKTNNVFVGSYGRGISVYSPYNSKFDVFTISDSFMSGKETNAFTDAIEDSLGHLITGTYNGFLVFDKKTWKYKHYLPGKSYEENKILTLVLAPDQTIWLSSPRCLYRYDKDFNKLATYIFDPLLKDHEIFTLLFDFKKNLWVGLFTKGLIKIPEVEWRNRKKTKLKYTLYLKNDEDPKSISSNQHWILYNDGDTSLLIGGVGGLDRYNYATDNFTRIFNPGTVKNIDRDSNGTLWLGTIGNGLFSYDLKTSESIRYTTENGLRHSFIYGILADDFKNLWVTSERGLTRLNLSTSEFRHYDKRDGLPDDHFDDKSESKLSDGRLYFGTNNGFVIFHPENISEDSSETNVVLTGLYIDNKKVQTYQDIRSSKPGNIPISKLKSIDLEPAQRDIEFRFAALHFSAPQKIKYSYMLKGYDNDWISADIYRREAKYTNLTGGKYTFILKATNSAGKWTNNPLEINLIVHPPYYKSLVFKIFGFLVLSGIIFVYFRLKLLREKKHNLELSKKVKERTREISQKNNQLEVIAEDLKESNSRLKENQSYIEDQSEVLKKQRDELATSNATKDKLFSVIAHDLKAPFNVILGYNDLLIERFGEWNEEKQLNVLQLLKESSESAYNLLENLLQWAQSQSGTLRFDPQNIQVSEIIKTVLPDTQLIAKRKGVQIINHAETENSLVNGDLNMLNTILRNLIINAIKYSKKGDAIEISATRRDNKFMFFSIKDSGIGMLKDDADKLFIPGTSKSNLGTSGEKGTGIGLILCKEFVEYHKGNIWVESEVNKGTTVCFTIPLA